MSVNDAEFDFDEFDKPGAERSRRRRGEDDDDIESDLEEELLGDDGWTSSKKPSELSDEELNDDLLQSDDEDQNISTRASYSRKNYEDDTLHLEDGYQDENYQNDGDGEYSSQDPDGDQMDYSGEPTEGDDGYQDEVLDLGINESIDEEFQDADYSTSYAPKAVVDRGDAPDAPEEEFVEDEVSSTAESSQVEGETVHEEESREESDEEDEDDEESRRSRFKSERKDGAVVRLADAGKKRSNIPETLELSEKAKADLRQYEEQEERKRQGRFSRGRGGRGGRGRGGMPGFPPHDMRGNRRRMNDQRYPFMGNMNMQHPGSRMAPHPQHHPRPRGPSPFPERPLVQQPLQPLLPPHMIHREPPPPRLMSAPPPGYPQHPPPPPPQPKNIHINPHFRGPAASVQVPLMPPAQSQPRPAVGPPRFPGQGDFQQHMSGGFGQPSRPPPHMDPYRSHPPPGPQEREPLFMGDHADPPLFPGQPLFEHRGPLMSPGLPPPPQVPGPTHLSFGPPGPPFSQSGPGPLGLFQRDQPSHPPRPFLGPRQQFGPRNHFNIPPVHFRMQAPHPQESLNHPPPPHHHHHQPNEPLPMMHSGQNPFHPQQAHGGPRQSSPRSQNNPLRSATNRQRAAAVNQKQTLNPQRNSNLREVPVAPGNASLNQPPRAMGPNLSSRGRGRGSARGRGGGAGGVGPQSQTNAPEPGPAAQLPEEDEETRQYRLKIEEQKRLREEILKQKEMRRQMQAGVRKKELLDRLQSTPQNQPAAAPPQNPAPQPQPPQPQPRLPQQRPPRHLGPHPGPALPTNGAPKNFNAPVRTRMPMCTNQAPLTPLGVQSQPPQRRAPPNAVRPLTPIRAAPMPQNTSMLQPPGPRPGAKRTVMQRAPGAAADLGQVPPKVRMIKLSAAGDKGSEVAGVPLKEPLQGPGAAQRKIAAAAQQKQGNFGNAPQNRVVVSGRGRGRGAGPVAAGRALPTRQSQKAAETGPATVSIEGLSLSTTEAQLKNLLKSIGPIEMLKMIPQHRKAIARFSSPQHAASFQSSFHRHMIDLSHIDVSLIDG